MILKSENKTRQKTKNSKIKDELQLHIKLNEDGINNLKPNKT